MKNLFKNFIIFFLAFLTIAAIFSFYNSPLNKPQEIGVGELIDKINSGEVQKVTVDGDKLDITLKNGDQVESRKEPTDSFSTLLNNYQVDPAKLKGINIEIKNETSTAFWLGTILPFLIPFLLIAAFIYFMMRQVQGTNNRALMFGQSRAREVNPQNKKNRITFNDVAGAKEAKEELMEVVDFLKNPKKFTSLGARIPKGVLLVGPPGTGKTLLARAVAGEANVPFFHISGSEFVEMFVGVGASRVRDLFRKAKKNAPDIIFIDEIDAVGRQRGAGLGGSHDEREQTLNQILVELDGFEANANVIVMAATNRPDVLDPALLRPGRFDRRVVLDLPSLDDREKILQVHAKSKPLDSSVNLRAVAERTPGFSGADLANLLNEAAILTGRRNKKRVSLQECLESIEKVILGPERKSHVLNEKEKEITAYHEAGHALVSHQLPNTDPVRKISIVARGQAGGYTLKYPSEDRYLHFKAEFVDDLAVMLAGLASEKEIFKDITTGAQNDLKQATALARRLVTEFGMSETLGPQTFGRKEELIFLGREISEQRDYSEKVATLIDQEVSKFLKKAYENATEIIKKMKPKLKEIAELLIKKETIEQKEFEALLKT
ncbi:MAG: cell division protein FtsH [Candidatus Kerfeldbacteria bacterium CG_4_10_14_0_8_um_filter_42_10]|uniref:ATP-dependent zinc metalloprotease FtsH n=1 Tax=Candidatus Kerfeldbacteria bacterium CG_4_10_14_0_8_um_filter_42_10 TaxID=2014248 RepID=A0A2M7RIR7_9BACT|nr:MAG: cell division protein FtsH [Candidatus Kerfeldbacteria bacterium CG_4_10_14_0_8_um_filter_42_10]